MINFEKELKNFQPSLEVEEAEAAIYNHDLTDVTDIITEILRDAGQREGSIWLDVYYRDFLFADAFELQVSEPEHGRTFTRNEAD